MKSTGKEDNKVALAIFDLDNTLIGGDSDYLWGQYLAEQGVVDGDYYESENQRFYAEYKAGELDIHEFLRFSLKPLARHAMADLQRWRSAFIAEKIEPLILPAAEMLVDGHRIEGDTLLIVTATNRFVTEPIAERFGISNLIATEPEIRAGRYTGEVKGTPSFQQGKVERLNDWLAENGETLQGSCFYSDSHNDLPLLELVERPVAVDADETLLQHARARGWETISLR